MVFKGIQYFIAFSLICFTLCQSKAQTGQLTLEDCYALAEANYPAIKKMDLVTRTAAYAIKNVNKKFLPQFNISGQASYQSQVVDYADLLGGATSSMGVMPPEFSKDQYRISGEIEQLLFDGGNAQHQKEIANAEAGLKKQNIAVELYAIKDRINSISFSIFLIDAQLRINQLKIINLQTQLEKIEAAYTYGTAYASDVNEIKAEIQDTKAVNIDYEGTRSAFLRMLSIFVGKKLTSSAALVKPEPVLSSDQINRPELKMFDLQKDLYKAKSDQLKASYLPSFKAFFQGAYGRPTLNPLSNDFGSWYITGIRLSWSLGNLYTLKQQRAIYDLQSQSALADKATFLQNVHMDIAQQDENVRKYQDMIVQDQKTIALRALVTRSASAQLENGVITTHEYIQKVNQENVAKQNLSLHQIQLLQAQHNLKFKSGN